MNHVEVHPRVQGSRAADDQQDTFAAMVSMQPHILPSQQLKESYMVPVLMDPTTGCANSIRDPLMEDARPANISGKEDTSANGGSLQPAGGMPHRDMPALHGTAQTVHEKSQASGVQTGAKRAND